MRFRYSILFFSLAAFAFAQNSNIDSLQSVLNTAKNDTNKVNTLILLAKQLDKNGNFGDAIKNAEEAARLATKIKFKKGLATAYTVLGNAFFTKGKYTESLKYNLDALKIKEDIGDKKGISDAYGNIGNVHLSMFNFKDALRNYHKVLKIKKEINDDYGQSVTYYGIGNVYVYQNNIDSALINYGIGLEIMRKLNDLHGMAYFYNNIGALHENRNDQENALKNYSAAQKIQEQIGDQRGLSTSYNNIASIYLTQKKYSVCENYALKGLAIAEELGALVTKRKATQILNELYLAQGNYRKAYEYFNEYIRSRDTLINKENTRKTVQLEMQYEFDKQAAIDSVNHAKEKLVQEAEIQKQEAELKTKRTQQYFLFGGLALVIVFAGFMYNRFKVTQKQKGIIEEQKTEVEQQKHLVEEKQKEILDSINYAKRIQKAHLPTDKYVTKTIGRLKK